MHKFAKQIMDCVKAHVDGIGIENFEGQNLDDLKDWTEIAKNIVCFDKDYNIVEAMKKSEDEEIMRMTPRKFKSQLDVHHDVQQRLHGGKLQGNSTDQVGYIDQIPGW